MNSIEFHETTDWHLKMGHTIYPISPFVWNCFRLLIGYQGYILPLDPCEIQGDQALKMADALTDALEDIPDHDVLWDKRVPIITRDDEETWGLPYNLEISPIEWFSYDGGKDWLKEFILLLYRHRGYTVKEVLV